MKRYSDDEVEDAYSNRVNNAVMHPFRTMFKVGALLTVVGFGISAVGYVGGWFSDAAHVAKKEFSASAMLKKYEWFKDAAAQLSAKKANIEVLRSRTKMFDQSKADRTEREKFMTWSQELAGVTANYNSLAADWNSQISKFNWKPFVSQLPAGAEQVLSQEFAPYATE